MWRKKNLFFLFGGLSLLILGGSVALIAEPILRSTSTSGSESDESVLQQSAVNELEKKISDKDAEDVEDAAPSVVGVQESTPTQEVNSAALTNEPYTPAPQEVQPEAQSAAVAEQLRSCNQQLLGSWNRVMDSIVARYESYGEQERIRHEQALVAIENEYRSRGLGRSGFVVADQDAEREQHSVNNEQLLAEAAYELELHAQEYPLYCP